MKTEKLNFIHSVENLVTDPAEGPGSPRPPPPLFLDQTDSRRAEKNFFWWPSPPPLSKGLDDHAPPLSQGLDQALQW